MNRFYLFIFLIAGLQLTSCSKKDKESAVPAAIQTIIDERKPECVCLPYIDLYTWRNQEVYLLAFKGPTCNWIPGYFNSQGQTVTMPQDYNLYDFLDEAKLVKKVWNCSLKD